MGLCVMSVASSPSHSQREGRARSGLSFPQQTAPKRHSFRDSRSLPQKHSPNSSPFSVVKKKRLRFSLLLLLLILQMRALWILVSSGGSLLRNVHSRSLLQVDIIDRKSVV